ncbi:MAG: CoA pyrophosphatase [Vulcanimicrobiaceae bacterium]
MLFAAVIIPIVTRDRPTLVFVRRAAHLRRNPGEFAFPGGLIDPSDVDARAAALREFEEELGVRHDRVRVIARLDDVVTLALSVTVTPFVGIVEPPLSFAHDRNETQGVHEVPLAALYVSGALHYGVEAVDRDGTPAEVATWLFDHDDVHVWGATGRMLRALVDRYPTPATFAA